MPIESIDLSEVMVTGAAAAAAAKWLGPKGRRRMARSTLRRTGRTGAWTVRTVRTYRLRRWGASRRLARRLATPDVWDSVTAQAGLSGLRRGKVRRTPYGIDIYVKGGAHLPHGAIASRVANLEAGLGAHVGTLRLVPSKRADASILSLQLRDPLGSPVPWPGHPSGDITKPIALGMSENGKKIEIRATQRLIIAGTSGAGKSTFLRILGSAAVTSANARLVYIDPKAVEGQTYKGLAEVATTADDIRAVVRGMKADMQRRLTEMAQRGEVDHKPTAADPAWIITVDEGAELKRLGLDDVVKDLTSIAQLGRAAHFWLHWASQYLTDKSGGAPVGIFTQAEAVVGLRVESARINRTVFGDGAEASGWCADYLPQGGGWFLLRDPRHPKPVRARAYFLEPADVRALSGQGVVSVPDTGGQDTDIVSVPDTGGVPADLVPYVLSDRTEQLSGQDSVSGTDTDRTSEADAARTSVADDVWSVLATSGTPLGVSELARRTGRSKGALHRTLGRMTDSGTVTRNESGAYALPTTVERGAE